MAGIWRGLKEMRKILSETKVKEENKIHQVLKPAEKFTNFQSNSEKMLQELDVKATLLRNPETKKLLENVEIGKLLQGKNNKIGTQGLEEMLRAVKGMDATIKFNMDKLVDNISNSFGSADANKTEDNLESKMAAKMEILLTHPKYGSEFSNLLKTFDRSPNKQVILGRVEAMIRNVGESQLKNMDPDVLRKIAEQVISEDKVSTDHQHVVSEDKVVSDNTITQIEETTTKK